MTPWLVAVLALQVAMSGAAAAAERVRLSFTSEASQCPDQAEIEAAIAARLGYSPFDDAATRALAVHIGVSEAGLSGVVELFDAQGAREGARTFQSPTTDCTELAASIELAMTIAIDAQAAAPAVAPAPPAAVTARAPTPPAAPAAEPVHFSAAVWAAGALGLSPGPTVGAALRVAVRYRAFVAAAEGWAEVPSGTQVLRDGAPIGTAQAGVLAGSLMGCGLYRWVGLCAVASVAGLRITGSIGGVSTRETVVLPLGGARVLATFGVGPLSLEPFLEIDLVVRRVSVVAGQDVAWVTPPVAGRLGLALSFELF